MYSELIMTYDNKNADPYEYHDVDPDYTIWTIYHGSATPKIFNLKETQNNKLFNTANIEYSGLNLNHLNRFICEACGIIYPFMNDLKSDMIGFEHYRRRFNTVYKDRIKNGETQGWSIRPFFDYITEYNLYINSPYISLTNHCANWYSMTNGIFDDIVDFLSNYYPDMLETAKQPVDLYMCSIFVCTWDKYEKLAKFIIDYINYINLKYKLGFSEYKWYMHIYEKTILHYNVNSENDFMNIKNPYFYNCEYNHGYVGYVGVKCNDNIWRLYAYHIEYLISLYLHTYEKVFIPYD